MNIAKEFVEALKEKKKTEAYDTQATIVRIEDGVAWVHIPGGIDETPVKKTIEAAVGDTVQVRVSGGSAFIVGNASAPPTDDKRANLAYKTAEESTETAQVAIYTAEEAEASAEDAKKVANNYLSADNTGVMVADMSDGQQIPSEATGRNVFIDNDSVDIRDGQNVLASFGEAVRIGRESNSRIEIEGERIAGTSQTGIYFEFSNTDSKEREPVTERFYTVEWDSYALRYTPADETSMDVTYTDEDKVTKTATLTVGTEESINLSSTAVLTYDGGRVFFWENPEAEIFTIHVAYTADYFAPSYNMGSGQAIGAFAYTFGRGGIAYSDDQMAVGKFNEEDYDNTYLFMVGNGQDTTHRSNAMVVDRNGNIKLKGDVYVGCNSYSDGGEKLSGLKDYKNLDNKPQIESVTLIGNKTFEDLGLSTLTNNEIETMLT